MTAFELGFDGFSKQFEDGPKAVLPEDYVPVSPEETTVTELQPPTAEGDHKMITTAREQVQAAYTTQEATILHTETPASVVIPSQASARVEKLETLHAKPRIRKAELSDIDALVALDTKLFRGAYGEATPSEIEVREMMTRRWQNAQKDGAWMYVQEQEGAIKGFITAFRTNKSGDEFTSWEDSTNNGTLDGVVDPNGRYAYVANLTVGAGGNKAQLMSAPLAESIKAGVEYGYFIGRMPLFRLWAAKRAREEGIPLKKVDKAALDNWAHTYASLTKKNKKGREVPHDYELQIYHEAGFEMGAICPEAFKDAKSLNYGVVFKVPVPFNHAPKPIRSIVSRGIKFALRFPKLLEKI